MGALIANIVIIVVLMVLVIGACVYIHREKKKGRRCIGCPSAATCPKRKA